MPAIHRNRTEIRDLFARTIAPGLASDDPRELAEAARALPARAVPRARRSASAARTSASPRPARSASSSRRATAACARRCRRCSSRSLGIEKLVPTLRRPRGLPPAAAALVDRRADEPVHVALDRRDRRRRAAGAPRRAARQRPHARARATRSAARRSHCIRCSACLNVCPVYSRTGGHAYGSVYPGPIGAILTPQLVGIENARVAAVRVEPLRRLLRGLPGQDRHPDACCCTCAAQAVEATARAARARRDAGRRAGSFGEPAALRARPAARPARAAAVRRGAARSAGCPAARRLDATPRPAAARRARPSASGGRSGGERARTRSSAACARALGGAAPPAASRATTARAGALAGAQRVELFCERVADYRADVRRVDAGEVAAAVAEVCAARGVAPARRPARPPGAWRPAGVELVEDHGLDAARARRARRRRSPAARVAIAETGTIVLAGGADARGGARSRSSRTCTSASSARAQIVELRAGGDRRARPRVARAPPADVHLGPVGDLRHRAQPRRGRPRPADARRARRGCRRRRNPRLSRP